MSSYYKNKNSLSVEEGIDKAIAPIVDNMNGSYFLQLNKPVKNRRPGGEARFIIHHCEVCEEPYFRRDYYYKHVKHLTCSTKCKTIAAKDSGDWSSPNKLIKTTSGYLYFKDKTLGRPYDVVYAHHWTIFKETGKWPQDNMVVHHIDIDKENNEFDNLWECTNSKHRIAHDSLNNLVAVLIELDIIEFDKEEGIYKLINKQGDVI